MFKFQDCNEYVCYVLFRQKKNINHSFLYMSVCLIRIHNPRVHFWAPTFKWGISIANIADFAKPTDKISYPQQLVVACSGVIWFRYGMVITPKNWNLSSVNLAMAGTGICQLARKIKNDFASEVEPVVAKE
ncbi:mitochondrial pyruvate carrier 4 isoform X1 [Brassica rapa]|uniref:mitochondrial pyruvate carrier 4 isoform X1 n=1 Tax=Brassica campestris TaxID=3711 RepID=UPI000872CB09|nr:mitochondrial pyruvate carrier 4 isoform X1 [Brassica rapa]